MSYNEKIRYLVGFVLILFIGFALVLGQSFATINIMIFIISAYAFFFQPGFLIFLTLIFLPTNGIFGTDYNLLGVFSPLTTTQLFSFIYLISNVNRYKHNYAFNNYVGFNKIIKVTLLLLVSFAVYVMYSDIKNGLLNIYDVDGFLALKRTIKSIVMFGFLILLIKNLHLKRLRDIVDFSILVSIIFLIVTAFFTDYFAILGLRAVDASQEGLRSEIIRVSGFFGWGDVNSFGGLLVIYLGYHIQNTKFSKVFQLMITLLIMIGIIYTGSRTAIVTSVLIIFFSFFLGTVNLKINQLFPILLALIIIYIIPDFRDALFQVLNRFQSGESELDVANSGTRIGKWALYYYYMIEHPYIFITGTFAEFWLNLGGSFMQRRVPHNVYISIIFHGGLVPFIMLLIAEIRLFVLTFRFKEMILLLIPFVGISMYVSEFGYVYFFVLLIPILYHNKKCSV